MKNKYIAEGEVTKILVPYKGTVLEVLIDTNDLDLVKSFPNTWFAYNSNGSLYVTGSKYVNGKRKLFHFARFIMKAEKDKQIDHINHNTLDNRRSVNLREVSRSENLLNPNGAYKNSKTGVRGVCWHKRDKKWRVQIQINGKKIWVGAFKDYDNAVKASKQAVKEYVGDFAKV